VELKSKLNPFAPRERFLVLEISPKGAKGLFLNVDENRRIVFEKSVDRLDLENFLASPFQNLLQKSWEGQRLFKFRRKIIVAADPSVATTIPVPLEIPRDRGQWDEEITIAELENLIAQAMQKVFNACRTDAATRLGVDDIHAILVGAKTKRFTIDGRSVMNPVGFAGRKISLLLELTFTGRALFDELKQFFSAPEAFFFVEAPQVRLASLSRVRKLPVNLVVADGDGAALFVLRNGKGAAAAKDTYPVLHRGALAWSFGSIFNAISAELGVSERTAEGLYCSYIAGEMSESARRTFKKIFQPALDDFLKEIADAHVEGTVYVDAPHELPFALPHRHGAVVFERIPVPELLEQFGFAGGLPDFPKDARVASAPLLYFLEAYFDKSNSEINQKLRRRLHWLAE